MLRIYVSGEPGKGKSKVARAIKDLLAVLGVKGKVYTTNCEVNLDQINLNLE